MPTSPAGMDFPPVKDSIEKTFVIPTFVEISNCISGFLLDNDPFVFIHYI